MSKRSRRRVALLGVTALTGSVLAGVGATTAANADTMEPASADRTMPHIEIGVPGEDIGDKKDAGLVEVRYSGGTTKSLRAPNPEAGARFGTATTAYDYDNDRRQDLFVGAPGKDVGGLVDAGAVYVFHGTPNGLVYERTITSSSPDVPGDVQADAEFGASLFHDSYQGDGSGNPSNHHVQIGAPGYDVDGAEDAGAVLDLNVPRPEFSLLSTANSWADGEAEPGARFGTSITENDLIRAIGAPGTTVNGERAAGAIYFGTMVNTGVRAIAHQDSPGMPGTAEAGDRFGSALTQSWERIYIGVPGEDIGGQTDAGTVSSIVDTGLEGLPEPGPNFHQNSVDDVTDAPLTGSAEEGDRFGSSLACYQERGNSDDATARIYVGVPGEDLGQTANAGMVNILHNPNARSVTDAKLGGTNEARDRFGAELSARFMDLPTAVIGIPGENDGSGVVKVVQPTRHNWWQITGAREAGDNYGASVGSSL